MSTRGEQPAVMVIGAYQSRPEAGGCGTSSTGSWDTTFSSEESGMPAQHDYSNSIGSPVGHLHSFDRTQSAPFSHLGQHMAASLSLEDSPFAAQVRCAHHFARARVAPVTVCLPVGQAPTIIVGRLQGTRAHRALTQLALRCRPCRLGWPMPSP